jgi:hypothetical protein
MIGHLAWRAVIHRPHAFCILSAEAANHTPSPALDPCEPLCRGITAPVPPIISFSLAVSAFMLLTSRHKHTACYEMTVLPLGDDMRRKAIPAMHIAPRSWVSPVCDVSARWVFRGFLIRPIEVRISSSPFSLVARTFAQMFQDVSRSTLLRYDPSYPAQMQSCGGIFAYQLFQSSWILIDQRSIHRMPLRPCRPRSWPAGRLPLLAVHRIRAQYGAPKHE